HAPTWSEVSDSTKLSSSALPKENLCLKDGNSKLDDPETGESMSRSSLRQERGGVVRSRPFDA
ncbi:MAG TPA: hypothetical protein VFB15_07245, partial [Candidatus Binataceae bacterium]|nr:hypothetical protein [Candidatus Binataceae bacterium]